MCYHQMGISTFTLSCVWSFYFSIFFFLNIMQKPASLLFFKKMFLFIYYVICKNLQIYFTLQPFIQTLPDLIVFCFWIVWLVNNSFTWIMWLQVLQFWYFTWCLTDNKIHHQWILLLFLLGKSQNVRKMHRNISSVKIQPSVQL